MWYTSANSNFFNRIHKAHEGEADAIADAVSYMFENPNPSQLTRDVGLAEAPAQDALVAALERCASHP